MSDSRGKNPDRPFKAPRKHRKTVLCDNCGQGYPEEEITVEVDEATKKVTGRFCGDCI